MSERLSYLFERYMAGLCTQKEMHELMGLALEPALQDEVSILIGDAWALTGEAHDLPEERATVMMEKIFSSSGEVHMLPETASGRGWWRWVAAASLLIAVLGIYFFQHHRSAGGGEMVKNMPLPAHDVAAPAAIKARITLANGHTIVVDSVGGGGLAIKDGVKISRDSGGNVIYHAGSGDGGEVGYNTLENPRGSRVATLVLADGTRVWLNSESSLRYFTSVGKGRREVAVTGEAYFEVAADANRPFIVSANGVTTEVLGTSFNVNAFPEEKHIAVTLLDGKVSVRKGAADRILHPGEQARAGVGIDVTKDVDVKAVMAWKNGLFQFVNADLPTVLQQLARWYDLQVVYEGAMPARKFEGKIQRNLSLSDVLDALARNRIHYSVEGNKLTVRP